MKNTNNIFKVTMMIAIFLAVFSIMAGASAANVTVTSNNSSSQIQNVINTQMNNNDTLNFEQGTYQNISLTINKTIKINGKGSIINGTGNSTLNYRAFDITANNVEIYNITIQNYNQAIYATGNQTKISNNTIKNNFIGICLFCSNNHALTNNTANNNIVGIKLDGSSNNVLINNNASNNEFVGIIGLVSSFSGNIYYPNNNTLINNTPNNNFATGGSGIVIGDSINNILINNTANNNTEDGIHITSSNNNILINNTANNNAFGILIVSSNNNTLTNNTANNNNGIGIYFHDSINNAIIGNSICNNGVAIYFYSAFEDINNNVFNFNRIAFNNESFVNDGTNFMNNDASFNWWGSNTLPNEVTNLTGFKINNWLIIQLNTGKTGIITGNKLTYNYYLLLNNGTRVNLDKFPFFNGTLTVNNVNSTFIDKTLFTKKGTMGTIPYNVSVTLDNQTLSLQFNPLKRNTTTTITHDISSI